MYEKRSTPAIIKIDGDKVGSCSTIQNFTDIPKNILLKISLQADIVKDTKWEEAKKEISLVVLPTFAPLPFGTDRTSIQQCLTRTSLNRCRKYPTNINFGQE
jgi:hypothetical protein